MRRPAAQKPRQRRHRATDHNQRAIIMRLFFATTAAAALLATPCMAQGADKADFSGFRLEALGGYDHVSGDGDGKGGAVYGLAAGYDAALGRARLGIEAEATESTIRQREAGGIVAGDRLRTDLGRDLYLGVRAGYVLSPSAMIYAKAGYTNARATARYISGTTSTKDSTNLDGFRAGAGVEVALSPRFYVKGEYRYSHYGDQNGLDVDADRHQLMAGVGVRF
jgi:outer membrane immunogenic protein